MKIAGKIKNFATEDELHLWATALSSADPFIKNENSWRGVNEDHILYEWFITNCYNKIIKTFGDPNLKLMCGMYLNEKNPLGIHTDAYHAEPYENRKTAISFLMPLSVDNNESLADKSRTIIFNEHGKNNKQDILTDKTKLDKTASQIYSKHLSHNDYNFVNKFTIYDEYQWERGSIIWWAGDYYHDSDNFTKNGYNSKQALVVHTYYDC